MLGVALLGGIGFTVSLLIGELAFGYGTTEAADAKIGVLIGSLIAGVLAAGVLVAATPPTAGSTSRRPPTKTTTAYPTCTARMGTECDIGCVRYRNA